MGICKSSRSDKTSATEEKSTHGLPPLSQKKEWKTASAAFRSELSNYPEDAQQIILHNLKETKPGDKLDSQFVRTMKVSFKIKRKEIVNLRTLYEAEPDKKNADEEELLLFDDSSDSESEYNLDKYSSQFPKETLQGWYKEVKPIDNGAFGVVMLCGATKKHESLPEGFQVAIKKLKNVFKRPKGTKRLVRELRINRYLSGHPNITRFFDIKVSAPLEMTKFKEILLVMELMEGNLQGHLKNLAKQYTVPVLKSITKQIICGVKYMHTAGFVHRDLKPQNILVKQSPGGGYDCKLCDFGLARSYVRGKKKKSMEIAMEKVIVDELQREKKRWYRFEQKPTDHVVTRYYRAPEISLVLQTWDTMPAMDIWSIGCIFAELLQMVPENQFNPARREILLPGRADWFLSPKKGQKIERQKQQLSMIFDFFGTPDPQYISRIRKQIKQPLRKHIEALDHQDPVDLRKKFKGASNECLDFFRGMMRYDPEERFTVDDCLNHPWLADAPGDNAAMNLTYKEKIFEDFENQETLSTSMLRMLVVQEVLHFNPGYKEKWVEQLNLSGLSKS